MSSDGAHLGLGAESAMKAIVGGEEAAERPMTAGEMKDWILAAQSEDEIEWDYNEAARFTAKCILKWLLADPHRSQSPAENEYEKDQGGKLVFNARGGLNLITPGWHERMKAEGIEVATGITGFQWGWAVNAARRCLELDPLPNPAIITIG